MTARRSTASTVPDERRERGVWSYIAAGISAGLLLIVAGIAVAVIVVPWVTGSVPLTVLTRSMEPSLPPGTLVVVQPVAPSSIAIGDVITYQVKSGEAEYITHRVIAISSSTGGDTTFTTQGDNNAEPDGTPVIADQVMGRVWYSVPWIGWLNNAVGGGGKTWLVVGLAVLLFAYAGWQFIGGLFRRRKDADEKDAQVPAQTPSD